MQDLLRHSTGIPQLDERLGGGLFSGRLTVVVGSAGIGKTLLGLHYAQAGQQQEGKRGVIFDVSSRGDSQHHQQYAQSLSGWQLKSVQPSQPPQLDNFFDRPGGYGDYLHVFDYSGRRVTRTDLDTDTWHNWQTELNVKLQTAIGFLYGNLAHGCRRLVVDGIEPVDRPSDSVQVNLFEYLYHQVLRKNAA